MVESWTNRRAAASEGAGERAPFTATLRAEYDPFLLDTNQRAERARRVEQALRAAGVWNENPRILDVGCGSGLLLSALATDARRRVGCDVRRTVYVQARPPGVVFVQGAAGRLPLKAGSFDLVICLAAIGEFAEWRAALDDMARCVAPGGVLYITVANSRFLLPLYRVARWLGRPVPASFIAYARACARLRGGLKDGFGVASLHAWRAVDITPHLALGQLSLAAPLWLVRPITARVAPSFGFAWQRPT
jgi:SAM-dependent methyltransferase